MAQMNLSTYLQNKNRLTDIDIAKGEGGWSRDGVGGWG